MPPEDDQLEESHMKLLSSSDLSVQGYQTLRLPSKDHNYPPVNL